ncbi:transcriptional regulator, LuxR family [Polaromonas sp. YR568]|uniref:helix-turn-helix transcriptional regulator n=1 Tax=Polaromonas sp. YR568 TaxID=1855301 RepID=UPI0008EE2B80|nr:LuxR C-terminal-related transcriptional regulator [Polaromonas sp. YR568]SFU99827.1 transcriptional regulator, LuxR family [Polaromonas sp. YR568]
MYAMQETGLLEEGRSLPLGETELYSTPALLALLVDELAHGVILVTAQCRILHANQAARRELEHAAVLGTDRGELKVLMPADAKAFQNAMGKAVAGKRSLIRLAAEGVDFTLAVVPLQRQPGVPCERMALVLSRLAVSESGVFSAFARNHGLTQTEEQVLVLLCRCLSTPEIAVQMNVAVSTVRSHVRSLCAKTASSGVRELVNHVAILPPIAPLPLGQIH